MRKTKLKKVRFTTEKTKRTVAILSRALGDVVTVSTRKERENGEQNLKAAIPRC